MRPSPQQLLEFMKLDYSQRNNRLRMHCPFHHDTDPSSGFYEDTELFHCFSCDITDDVVKFYARYIYGKITKESIEQATVTLEKRFGEFQDRPKKQESLRLAVAWAKGEEVLREARPKLDLHRHAKLGEIFDQLLLLHNRGLREECLLDTDLEMWYNSVKESMNGIDSAGTPGTGAYDRLKESLADVSGPGRSDGTVEMD